VSTVLRPVQHIIGHFGDVYVHCAFDTLSNKDNFLTSSCWQSYCRCFQSVCLFKAISSKWNDL